MICFMLLWLYFSGSDLFQDTSTIKYDNTQTVCLIIEKQCKYGYAWFGDCYKLRAWIFKSNDKVLDSWGRVFHIWVSKLTIIGSDNGLSPGRRQAFIYTNELILLIWHLRTHFSEISIEIHILSFKSAVENVVWETSSILPRPQNVNKN